MCVDEVSGRRRSWPAASCVPRVHTRCPVAHTQLAARWRTHSDKRPPPACLRSATMSGSDEEDSGNSGQKKDFMYKIKALKRRTIHTVAKNLGKAEQTKDPEFDELYERFEQIDAKMTALRNAAQKFNKAHQAMSEAGSELAHAYLDLYDKDPMLKKLAVEMEAVNEYMISDVSPQLGERWKAQVDEPIKTITDRMQEMKDDAERRKRYMADYDHYRSKKMNLEKAEGREKNLEKVRENEKKLAEASTKYFAMNERLTARLKIADNNKAAMLNEPLLAAIAVQNEIFQQGSAGFQKLYASSKEPKYLQAAQSEAEELARLDSQVKQVCVCARVCTCFCVRVCVCVCVCVFVCVCQSTARPPLLQRGSRAVGLPKTSRCSSERDDWWQGSSSGKVRGLLAQRTGGQR